LSRVRASAGNDFSTLFAPLVRDGRMDKFYWEPDHEEKVAMVHQLYKEDCISERDIATVIQRFRHQVRAGRSAAAVTRGPTDALLHAAARLLWGAAQQHVRRADYVRSGLKRVPLSLANSPPATWPHL